MNFQTCIGLLKNSWNLDAGNWKKPESYLKTNWGSGNLPVENLLGKIACICMNPVLCTSMIFIHRSRKRLKYTVNPGVM